MRPVDPSASSLPCAGFDVPCREDHLSGRACRGCRSEPDDYRCRALPQRAGPRGTDPSPRQRRDLLRGGGLEPGAPVHRDNLDPRPPALRPLGEPALEHRLRAALDDVRNLDGPVPSQTGVRSIFLENGDVRGGPGDLKACCDPRDREWSTTSARNAHPNAVRVSVPRGSATLEVSSCQNRAQGSQRNRRTRSSKVVGRCPNGSCANQRAAVPRGGRTWSGQGA